MDYAQFILTLIEGAAAILSAQKNKTAADIGADVQVIDQVVLAVLKKSAEVKGVAIDWSDPLAVSAYVSALPRFVPIPDASPDSAPLPGATAPISGAAPAPPARATGDNG